MLNTFIELFIPKILSLKNLKYFLNLYYGRFYYGIIQGRRTNSRLNYDWSKINCNRIKLVN